MADKQIAGLTAGAIGLTNVIPFQDAAAASEAKKATVSELQDAMTGKQDTLESSTNIKTINSTSLLGSGDVAVQATLVSGTNIKTINGSSVLGSGDLTVSGGLLQSVKVSLSSADLLQIGTTPIVVVPAQGAGTIIRPISVNVVVNFKTTSYSVNPTLTLFEGGWLPLLNMNNILSASATTYFNYPSLTTITTTSNVINEDLMVYGGSGDPSGGDSTVDLYVTYVVITL